MDKIRAWLKSKNITSHTVAVAVMFLATLYTSDQQVRDFVGRVFADHPVLLTNIAALAAIIFKYSHSSSVAGLLSAASNAQQEENDA